MAQESSASRWIPDREYEHILSRVPILCVDLLPLNDSASEVGLIRRETFDGDQGWCMVGGAVLRNEPLREALDRHVRTALGDRLACELRAQCPLAVGEYFSEPRAGELYDPRKHAVALTYAATCRGEVRPTGEALEFQWFDTTSLSDIRFGFGQGAVVEEVLSRLR